MRLHILHVPGCPSTRVLTARLDRLLAGHPGVVVEHRVIHDERDAARWGMTGSPTLLVNGADPFTAPDQSPAISCRLYTDETGRVTGAPSIAQLRHVLADLSGANTHWREARLRQT
jgi:predicted DsbA family dithiol-disulfide isomerase